MSHTRGPWRAVSPLIGGKYAGHRAVIPGGHGDNPPLCYLPKGRDDLQKANARLIAAAPELLAALRELVECKDMKDRLRSYEFGGTQEMAAFAEEYDRRKPAAWDAARAAITRAEGCRDV
jgi:hypothetical protein